jgi:hypothetical protein
MSGQHHPNASPYYENYVQKMYNHPDARATPSGSSPDMVLHEARYGKPVAQLSVRTLLVTIRTLPREIRSRLNLGLLSLYIEAIRHVLVTEFSIEFFIV